MRVAVMGAGATGGFFGSKLALFGHEVHFVGRGEHLQAVRERGLFVRSTEGEWRVEVNTHTDPATVPPVDLIILSVKNYDLESAVQSLKPMIGPETLIIPLQNGIDAVEFLREAYPQAAMGGSCHIEVYTSEPGLVVHSSRFAYMTYGEMSGEITSRAQLIYQELADADISVKLEADIRRALWQKFIYLTALSGLTTATLLPIGVLREVPETRRLIEQVVAEVVAVGRAEGVNLPENQEALTMDRLLSIHPTMRASMSKDRERGRRLEVDAIQGAVVRRAQKHGIPVPTVQTLFGILIPFATGIGDYNIIRAKVASSEQF